MALTTTDEEAATVEDDAATAAAAALGELRISGDPLKGSSCNSVSARDIGPGVNISLLWAHYPASNSSSSSSGTS